MRGNIPIPELPFGEEVWLMLAVTTVRERRTQQGKLFCDVTARNASGSLALKVWGEVLDAWKEIKPGLWGVTGRLETFQDRPQFVVSEYRPITLDQYREHQQQDPILPRAYTMDIETLALPDFRERVGPQLERTLRLGNMRLEQQQRYLEDIAAEEERAYQLGSLSATSGRVLSIAVHIAPVPGFEIEGFTQGESEHVFGIDADGEEQPEKQALMGFLDLMKEFDCETDEIVGHNVIGFDLPFIGIIDLVAEIDHKNTVADFKTAASDYEEHEAPLSDQLSAYKLAEPEAEQVAFWVMIKTKEPKIEWYPSNRSPAQASARMNAARSHGSADDS